MKQENTILSEKNLQKWVNYEITKWVNIFTESEKKGNKNKMKKSDEKIDCLYEIQENLKYYFSK